MRPCVLVVDDDPSILRTLERGLKRRGYDVMCAATADTAYGLLEDPRVDIVLLDLWMPHISGDALAVAIAHRWPRMKGRVILMSGDPALLERHREQGSKYPILAKPFSFAQVYELIEFLHQQNQEQTRNGTTNGTT
jgi:DNA-binding response OmpR family regulator